MADFEYDPQTEAQIQRLCQLNLYGRWGMVVFCWLTLGAIALWALQRDLQLMWEHFTWAAVRYTLVFKPVPSMMVIFCVAITTSTLVWQSRNILWGLPAREKYKLFREVETIRSRSPDHWLWKWVIQPTMKD